MGCHLHSDEFGVWGDYNCIKSAKTSIRSSFRIVRRQSILFLSGTPMAEKKFRYVPLVTLVMTARYPKPSEPDTESPENKALS